MNSGSDLIKNSVLQSFTLPDGISIGRIGITLLLAFVLGLFIYLIYKRTFKGVVFVRSFGISLVMLTMVTSIIIVTISSNLMLSLGMVGALSIVRFRTAVKDPLDTVYMFWAIAEGIILGAGTTFYVFALIAGLVVGLVMVVISIFKFKKDMPYIMVIRFEEGAKQDVQNLLRRLPQCKLKSKTVSQGVFELTMEINLKESDAGVIDKFAAIPGVFDASLVSYSGDVIS